MLGLMVASALMSAYSFWRATTYASEAATRRHQERVATMLAAQEGRHFDAMVAFDLGLTTRYCGATSERDAALIDSLPGSTGDIGPVVDQIVTQQLLAETRWTLFQANAPSLTCAATSGEGGVPAYSVDAAMEWQTAIDPRFGSGGALLAPGDGDPSRSEQRLMVAALAFAVALLFLTAADLVARTDSHPPSSRGSRDGPGRVWVAWVSLAVAAQLTGAALVALEAPARDLVLFGAVLLVAAVTLPASAVTVKHRGSPLRRPAHAASRRPTRFWAQLAGAMTLVGLTGAALGLSLVSDRERELRADADRYVVEADQLLDQGEQDALRDLSTVEELAELDARRAAVNQVALAPTAEAERIASSRVALASHASAVDDSTGADAEPADEPPGGDASGCPEGLPDQRTDAVTLLADAEADPMVLSDHIAAQSEAGRACNAVAATSRAAADMWDRRAGSFTVALVVLGLAGFLLALAADRDRSVASARWMLWIGVLAAAFGGLVAVSAAVSSTVGVSGRLAGPHFAEELAAGEVALLQGRCATALRHLDTAIADYDDHGPAHLARADAQLCSPDDDWLLGAPPTPQRVDDALRDLSAARDLGVADPTSALHAGWLHLLHAVQAPEDRDASLAAGRESTQAALDEMSDRQAGGSHYARFNLALAQLLEGSARAADSYDRAVACLAPSDGCDGLQDEQLRLVYALLALSDLELVDNPVEDVDDYRALIVNGATRSAGDRPDDAPVPDLGNWTLDVFPQELQVWSDAGIPDQPVSVVWFYRTRPDDPWSVIFEASLQTLVPGPHTTGRPIAVGRYLPAGEYRADVLVGGRLAASVLDEPGRHEPDSGYERVVVSELGFAATVPVGWQRHDYAYGLETQLASSTSDEALVVRRVESLTPSGDIEQWAGSTLDAWVAAVLGGDELGDVVPNENPWGFGAEHAVERDYPESDAWAAMGFVPYVAEHPECGGTALMAMTSGADDEASSYIGDSIVARPGLPGVPVVDGNAEMARFSLDVTGGWARLDPATPAERTMVFRAHHCSLGARAEIEVTDVQGASLDQSVDTLLNAEESELEAFDLVHRRTRELASGHAAVELEYTFVVDGTDVTRQRLLAVDESELYVVTVSRPTGGDEGVVDDLIGSFALNA